MAAAQIDAAITEEAFARRPIAGERRGADADEVGDQARNVIERKPGAALAKMTGDDADAAQDRTQPQQRRQRPGDDPGLAMSAEAGFGVCVHWSAQCD